MPSDLYHLTMSFVQSDGLMSEGEFLDITEIKRHQAEEFECITNNGVTQPDIRKVKVTVNCECPYKPQNTCMHSQTDKETITDTDIPHVV